MKSKGLGGCDNNKQVTIYLASYVSTNKVWKRTMLHVDDLHRQLRGRGKCRRRIFYGISCGVLLQLQTATGSES